MANWYLHNGSVYRNQEIMQESVLILGGMIVAFGKAADEVRQLFQGPIRDFDATGQIIAAGFIDLHTHLREPGFESKETIASGTMAAVAGGFTTVCPMPNTSPALDSLEALDALDERIRKTAHCKVRPIAALTEGRSGKKTVDYKAFAARYVVLYSDDGDPLNENIAQEVFLGVKEVGGVVINHLEDKALLGEGFFYEQIPPESEYLMLKRDLEFVRKTHCRYHVAHVSAWQTVELIAKAKEEGLPVTAEVTPHHLTLTHHDIKEPRGNFQMKPPLRTEKDRRALVEALKTGVIDIISTDHAPHGTQKENGLFEGSPFGVTALETTFPVLYSKLVLEGQLTLEQLLYSLTEAPASILGVESELKVGAGADLVVLDLGKERKVTKDQFKSKGTNSPHIGQTLQGWPVLTLVDGEAVYSC
ncbi:MAG TPA: dihydroorotase [Firmicutes bacterium]|jgi:dihydroorotase|nr:dihydroorotase [Bacillota bacterium]